MLTHTDRSAYYLTAKPGDMPTAGARDFGNQVMSVTAAKDMTDPRVSGALQSDADRRKPLLSGSLLLRRFESGVGHTW